jgi:hypothetical protein
MANSNRQRGRWRRVAALAALGLLAGTTRLLLITCSGTWQVQAHQYNERLVVYTRLLQ